jgi:hypothetical protein
VGLEMSKSPGTVSKILWHFTGGPEWDPELHRQKTVPKKSAVAYDILNKIIEECVLKTSSFSEVAQTLMINSDDDELKTIKTRPVCCLADIPIQHLGYHSRRYGKIAIGFHRHAVGPKFNPVLYNAIGSNLNIETGLLDDWIKSDAAFKLERLLHDKGFSADSDYAEIFSLIEDIQMSITASSSLLVDVLTYSKTFKPASEFDTIYCEREWRATDDYNFMYPDIAMIVLPRRGGYYKKFVEKHTELLQYFSVVAWEDLIEH